MPKVKHSPPPINREKGQRSVDYPLYLDRIITPLTYNPTWVEAEGWRRFVEAQPVAVDCREYLINALIALDWKIEPRDSNQRDELKKEIQYYEKFFNYTGEYDYTEIIEWIGKDMLDLPGGAGAEIGRQGDDPTGRVLWIQLLDGGTLFPYPNKYWPVYQYVQGYASDPIYFPYWAINRTYMSPRTEIRRTGWGMAPPEKIYMAIEMVSKGDIYYGSLLLDSPDAGILDLLDMSKESAETWIEGWRKMLRGIDPYKIPVLYEHNNAAKWLPFTRNPTEIAFGEAISRYGSLICSGYGMSISDIGLVQGSGNTLAGSIRDERRTKRNGFAHFKRKMTCWFDRLLPDTLRFRFVDLDEEMSVSLGRARLANATAMSAYVNSNTFTEAEVRQQALADGLMTITVGEELPPELQDKIAAKNAPKQPAIPPNSDGSTPNKKTAERPSMLGRPVTPSQGGWGEIAARSNVSMDIFENDARLVEITNAVLPRIYDFLSGDSVALENQDWRLGVEKSLWGVGDILPEQLSQSLDIISKMISTEETPDVIAQVVARSILDGLFDYIEDQPDVISQPIFEDISFIRLSLDKALGELNQLLVDNGIINSKDGEYASL